MAPRKAKSDRSGYVYILTNPSMPGLVKIGRTSRDPHQRIKEINSATGVPVPFELKGFVKTYDATLIEKKVHSVLSRFRINRKREFFEIDYDEAERTIRSVAKAEKLRFAKTPRFGVSSVFNALVLFIWLNVLIWLVFPNADIWVYAAFNSATALLTPRRLWRSIFSLLQTHPLISYGFLVLILVMSTKDFGYAARVIEAYQKIS